MIDSPYYSSRQVVEVWKLFYELQNKLPKALWFNEANYERNELTQWLFFKNKNKNKQKQKKKKKKKQQKKKKKKENPLKKVNDPQDVCVTLCNMTVVFNIFALMLMSALWS